MPHSSVISRAPQADIPAPRRQASPRPLQEAPGEHLIQRNVKIDFRQVLLVLHAVVRAEADGVAEVVDGETRHGGVQIDDADALMGVPVDQDVIQLRVIVGDAKRKLSLPQRPQSNAAVRFPPQNELNLRGYPLCPVQLIGFQRGKKLLKAAFGVVEMGNGLMERPGGIIPEHVLEPPERRPDAANSSGVADW